MSQKRNAALLSVSSNLLLIVMKLAVALLTGSVSILSEAIHSSMDLLAAFIAFVSVRLADAPPDADHPYGHEKFENVSGVIEGVLIVLASVWIMAEAGARLAHHGHVEAPGWGMAVMFVSALVNALVAQRLYRIARAEESMALEADALHLKADVYTALGVGVGLLAIWVTGWVVLDSLVAIGMALFILREAFELVTRAFAPLIDRSLPNEEIDMIRKVLDHHADEFIDYHDLRTRRSGKVRHIDLHLTLHRRRTLEQTHALCDVIEEDIDGVLPNAHVLIHPESCSPSCICPPLHTA